jgi:hypothetical protein
VYGFYFYYHKLEEGMHTIQYKEAVIITINAIYSGEEGVGIG